MVETLALPVRGTVDRDGRLTSADPALLHLQQEAGADLGSPVAVPQLAALVRLARSLGVTLSRQALAGTTDAELDLWVRVEPAKDEVKLFIERWTERPALPARWDEFRSSSQSSDEDWSFELDTRLRFVRVGAALARFAGIAGEGATGAALTRLVELQPDSADELPLLSAVAERRSFSGQIARSKHNGSSLSLSAEPRIGGAGEFAGYVGQAISLQASTSVSVDAGEEWNALLREPIDVIVTEADRIADRSDGPLRSDYAGYATDIASAARHLLDVLNSMSREGHLAEEASGPIDLAALAAEAAGLVQPQAAEAGITLELEGATSLPAIGQRRAVTQILVNLIGNAVRYSPRGTSVRIEAEAGPMSLVSVTDQGPGVAAKDRERIFEPFEQASSKKEGAGLGLAISRRLARSMGGDVTLDSTPVKGARFVLSLRPR